MDEMHPLARAMWLPDAKVKELSAFEHKLSHQ